MGWPQVFALVQKANKGEHHTNRRDRAVAMWSAVGDDHNKEKAALLELQSIISKNKVRTLTSFWRFGTRGFAPRCEKAESLGPAGSMIRYKTKKKRNEKQT